MVKKTEKRSQDRDLPQDIVEKKFLEIVEIMRNLRGE
jgi:hypothetical protein